MTGGKFLHSQSDLSIRISNFVAFVKNDVVEVLTYQIVLVGHEATVTGNEDALRLCRWLKQNFLKVSLTLK